MANATDVQMQAYMDQRVRPRAEAFREVLKMVQDDQTAITDEFARASNGPIWNDARVDGPPHLLASGPGSSPDDLTNYNALCVTFLALVNGTANATQISNFPGQWAIFQRACVRPVI
jgi:hypothetical protein